jgi:glycosyltransferase involved in cell wall biosynthesis
VKIYISNAIESERLPNGDDATAIVWGKAHYSWKIVASLYEAALQRIHITTRRFKAPDIYQSDIARKIAGIEKDDIHITVKPIEHIRPMFGARNFYVAGWEFPEFSDRSLEDNPKNNHVAILKRAEKILCWSEFTANNLQQYGVTSAAVLPPPVVGLANLSYVSVAEIRCLHYSADAPENNAYSTIGRVRADYQTVFFALFNPYDRRKRFGQLLEAFTEFSRNCEAGKGAALVIKLVVDNIRTRAEIIFWVLRDQYAINEVCPDIYFVGDDLDTAQIMGFYQTFDFYYCSSSTEGLNLPLIEAMASGMVPISSMATAMGDYIRPEHAVVLPFERARAEARASYLAGLMEISYFPVPLQAMVDGFAEAVAMSPAKRRQMGSDASTFVHQRYGLQRFEHDFRKLIDHL